MTMAKGTSKIKVQNPVSLHFRTMLALLRIMIPIISLKIYSAEKELV